jgi:hypothetical protein
MNDPDAVFRGPACRFFPCLAQFMAETAMCFRGLGQRLILLLGKILGSDTALS